MTGKEDYEVVRKLAEKGYHAVIRLTENGYTMKVKRILKTDDNKHSVDSQPVAIEPTAIGTVQKFQYVVKEIGVEEYDKGIVTRLVPTLICTREYPKDVE